MDEVKELQERIAHLQEQLKQQEKLASLGLLVAGIVHEIQNPLNFVINFSKMSATLLSDLTETLEENEEKLSEESREDVESIVNDLKENLSKIDSHGERAISIIRNILLYSRGKEDEFIPTDLCKLTKEYVWLSYHAMRANFKNFNISIQEDYQEGIPLLTVIPQDISRAVLNIMNNACYAVWEKSQQGDPSYKPTISVSVKLADGELCIQITDNGKGMTEEVKKRLFETFFTTKPSGQGTGLGMSITRDIIEHKHHGRILFDSEENKFTSFSLIIPAKQ